ncbi:MAG: RodZ domain-containing protein, partial [Candidatus Binatia bacterium]
LRLTATARQVWVWISIDGRPVQAVSLDRGESAEFKAEQGYVLTVDDAGGVEATLNGQSLPSFGQPAQARRHIEIPEKG